MEKITEEEQSMIRGRFIRRLWGNDEGYRISLYEIIEAPENTPDEFLRSGTFVAKGVFLPELEQLTVKFTGAWRKSKGKSALQVHSFAEETPKSKEAIIEYLSSGLFRGIGPKTAERIYDAFGKDAPEIIIHNPKRLTEVKGIGVVTAQFIAESVNENRAIQDLVLFFGEYGITLSKIKKIQEAFPYNTIGIVKNDPFRLCSINGFGFATVDSIAESLGTPLNSPLRIQAALVESIRKEKTNGNLFVRSDTLLTKALELLNLRAEREEEQIQKDAVMTEINAMLMSNKLASSPYVLEDGTKEIYLAKDLEKEKGIAAGLMEYINTPLPESDEIPLHDLEKALSEVEKELGITLALKQREAVLTALTHKMCIITGGPGTGKTTTILGILLAYKRMHPKDTIRLCAPTGRAAQRMAESTHMEAVTVHRLLDLKPYGDTTVCKDSSDPIDADLIVVDEMSMINIEVFDLLLEAIKTGTTLVLVGDINQLESVGAGAVLHDLLEAPESLIPRTMLTDVFRQKGDSSIISNAIRINAGITTLDERPDFQVIHTKSAEESLEQVKSLMKKLYNPEEPFSTQILCPARKGISGVENMNIALQALLNPQTKGITYGSIKYRLNDKVMFYKNNYSISSYEGEIGLYNGDIGKIVKVSESGLTVNVRNSHYEITRDLMDNLGLSYAMTIHKSQGSEFSCIIVVMPAEPTNMLVRNLFYTAVTRAKKKVYVIDESYAMETSIRIAKAGKRLTNLAEYLKSE